MRLSLATCAAALLLAASPGPAPAQDAAAALDALVARHAAPDAPGCALGLEGPDGAAMTTAWGLAELEHGAAATPETIYEAGSAAKQFTAAAIFLLVEDGRLSLDDDVRRHIPELPDYGATITVRHLLNHTSGLRDWGSVAAIEGWPRGSRAMTNAHVIALLSRQEALNFPPGSEWLYSNSGYNLAAEIVRRVSGESLADFTRRRIFEPLGMGRTGWRDDHTAVVPGRATAYARQGDSYRLAMPFEDAHGNGGLLTTVGDLLIWNRALEAGTLGRAVSEGLQTRGVAGGRETHYGLGLELGAHQGRREIRHGGATGGYRAWLARYPDDGVSVAVLCNTAEADAQALGRTAAAIHLGAGAAAAAFTPTAHPDGGLFVSARTGEPFGLRSGPQGLTTMSGRPLTPVAPGRYRMGDDELAFTDDGFDRISDGWDVIRYRRAEPARPDAAALAGLAGRYASREARVEVEVEVVGGRLALRRGAEAPAPLTPAQADVFVGPPGVVRFERDAAGRAIAFHINNGRVRDLVFRRVVQTED